MHRVDERMHTPRVNECADTTDVPTHWEARRATVLWSTPPCSCAARRDLPMMANVSRQAARALPPPHSPLQLPPPPRLPALCSPTETQQA